MDNKNSEEVNATKTISIYSLMFILILSSVVAITIRLFFIGNETLAGGDMLWRLSINATTRNIPHDTIIKVYPPFDTEYIRVIQRKVSHPGFKTRKSSEEEKYQRNINIIATDIGEHNIHTEYLVHVSQTAFTVPPINPELSTQKRESFLLDSERLQFKSYSVKELLKKLLQGQPDQDILVEKIYRFSKSIPIYKGKDTPNVPEILNRKKATIYDRALVMVSLTRAGGVPARLVSGLILKDDIETMPHYWVEVYQDDKWLSYDVFYGYKKTIPPNFLPIRRNNKNILDVKNGTLTQIEYDLEQEFNHPYLQNKQTLNMSSIFNLTRLPLVVRDELSILLLLPLGALITAFFGHVVGVHSYGVFTPTLLALAIIYADVMTTLIVFIVVIFLAIGGRSIFPDTLTRIPRLSVIFTLIAIILTFSVSVLNYFNIDQSGKIILLPIIILTSLVDRFYRTIEDKGYTIALYRMAWTIFIALLCIPIVQFQTLGNLILELPEIHLITLALFLWLSVYKGKKLINLPILKVFAEPKSPTKLRKA